MIVIALKALALAALWLLLLMSIALINIAGECSRTEEEAEMGREVKGMAKYSCGRPEWADEEDCPFETGEVKDCAECYWGKAKEEG